MSRIWGALWFGGITALAVMGIRTNQNAQLAPDSQETSAIVRTREVSSVSADKTSPIGGACNISDITIKSVRGGFKDECSRTPCYNLRGAAVLNNGCSNAIGVEIKIVGYDSDGAPVATRDLWPASTRNIPPGDYTFSLDYWLDFHPEIKRFAIAPSQIRQWRE